MYVCIYMYIYIGFPDGNGTPLQYSCLENPMDGGAWQATVHGVAKSQTRLSDFTFPLHALEKELATHSSVLAWRIPGTGEPGGLPSMRLHRVVHDRYDLAAAAAVTQLVKNLPAMQETQVQSLGQEGSLEKEMAIHSSTLVWGIPWTEDMAGYSPWDFKVGHNCVTSFHFSYIYIYISFFFILSELVLVCQLFLLRLSHIFSYDTVTVLNFQAMDWCCF